MHNEKDPFRREKYISLPMDSSDIWHMKTKLFSKFAPTKAWDKLELEEDSTQWLSFLTVLQAQKVISEISPAENISKVSKAVNFSKVCIILIEI